MAFCIGKSKNQSSLSIWIWKAFCTYTNIAVWFAGQLKLRWFNLCIRSNILPKKKISLKQKRFIFMKRIARFTGQNGNLLSSYHQKFQKRKYFGMTNLYLTVVISQLFLNLENVVPNSRQWVHTARRILLQILNLRRTKQKSFNIHKGPFVQAKSHPYTFT